MASSTITIDRVRGSQANADAGNILSDGDFTYSYVQNRLTKRDGKESPGTDENGFTYKTKESFDYSYDHFGNQIEEKGTTTLTYDHDGSVYQSTASATASYDASSHPLKITLSDGASVSYLYDGLDRMISRKETKPDLTEEVTLFFRDRATETIALETDGAGVVKTRYLLDSGGAPLAKEDKGAFSYPVEDPRANLVQVLDGAQAVRAVFAYDPYGREKPQHTQIDEGYDSRLRYQMAPRDRATGAYSIGPRIYHPATSTFAGVDFFVSSSSNLELQMDPLTGNRYLYAGANPVGMIDDGHGPVPDDCWWGRDCGSYRKHKTSPAKPPAAKSSGRKSSRAKSSGAKSAAKPKESSLGFCWDSGADYTVPCATQTAVRSAAPAPPPKTPKPPRLTVTGFLSCGLDGGFGAVVCTKGPNFEERLGLWEERFGEHEQHSAGSPWPRICRSRRCRAFAIALISALIGVHAQGFSPENPPNEHHR